MQVVTVATHECDGLDRFLRSCPHAIVLGLEQGKQFNMNYPGGGFKVNLLKEYLRTHPNEDEVILFTDSFDAVLVNGSIRVDRSIVLFSAEMFCWPEPSLASGFPPSPTPFRFLNSGGFVGTVKLLRDILDFDVIDDTDDDQLFYTRAFLSQRYKMKLDVHCQTFQTFNGAQEHLQLSGGTLHNAFTHTVPQVLHGNGCNKTYFNRVCDHVMSAAVKASPVFELPSVLVVFDSPACVVPLEYAVDILTVTFVHAGDTALASTDVLLPGGSTEDNRVRALRLAQQLKRDAVLFVSEDHRLSHAQVLTELCQAEKAIVAPMLVQDGSMFSNFWGDLDTNGYYKRSFDYFDIVNQTVTGIWNVPYIHETFLVRKKLFTLLADAYTADPAGMDRDMRVCKRLRDSGAFMFVDNRAVYGSII